MWICTKQKFVFRLLGLYHVFDWIYWFYRIQLESRKMNLESIKYLIVKTLEFSKYR
jgi:hypothetical protein